MLINTERFFYFLSCITMPASSFIYPFTRSFALIHHRSRSTKYLSSIKGRLYSESSDYSEDITSHSDFRRNHKKSVSKFTIYYNDLYEVKLPPNHRFPMEKYRQVREIVQAYVQKQNRSGNSKHLLCQFKESPLATTEELTSTHCPSYVQRFISGDQTEREQRNVGFPWSEDGVLRALSSVGGTLAAARDVCATLRLEQEYGNHGIYQKKAISWAAHVAGGTHHAFFNRGEGFCVFSDIAVAANVVLREFPDVIRRVLIIDLDVHQGNGNAKLFAGRDDVITFSMHCRENYFSPKESSDLDIELPSECNDDTYLQTLQHWLKRIFSESDPFDLIFFQAGVDILADDRLGRMNLSREGIKRRNDLIFEYALQLSLPLVITMGGGYPKHDWTPILKAHSDVYIGAYQFLLDRTQITDK